MNWGRKKGEEEWKELLLELCSPVFVVGFFLTVCGKGMNLLIWVWVKNQLITYSFFLLICVCVRKLRVKEVRFIWKEFKNWVIQWEKKNCMERIGQKRKGKGKKIVLLTLWNIGKAARGKCCHFHISGLSFHFDENWITFSFPNIVNHFTRLCHFKVTSNFKSQQV